GTASDGSTVSVTLLLVIDASSMIGSYTERFTVPLTPTPNLILKPSVIAQHAPDGFLRRARGLLGNALPLSVPDMGDFVGSYQIRRDDTPAQLVPFLPASTPEVGRAAACVDL
ncbi:hypothetical protein ADK55_28630, partial [Streptomyces sp. WM4235]|uniref:hypothetical protein n=1 Tax=Streptomyces sp. WM4235 TaxID=1415551 RepID=UPI0006C4870D